jgi:hypothetical protein
MTARPSPKNVAAKHREISIRYGWTAKQNRINWRWKVIAGCRRKAIENLVRYRYGELPDTDDRDLYLRFWAWHNLHSEKQAEDLFALGRRLGVELAAAEVAAVVSYCNRKPRKFSATTLGKRLHLTEAERAFLLITTIVPCDLKPAERKRVRATKRQQRRTQRRRAKNIKPRAQYLAESLSRTRPWLAEGVSRSTWERRRKAARQTRDASVAPSNLPLVLHGTTLAASSLAARQQARGYRPSNKRLGNGRATSDGHCPVVPETCHI